MKRLLLSHPFLKAGEEALFQDSPWFFQRWKRLIKEPLLALGSQQLPSPARAPLTPVGVTLLFPPHPFDWHRKMSELLPCPLPCHLKVERLNYP